MHAARCAGTPALLRHYRPEALDGAEGGEDSDEPIELVMASPDTSDAE